jgi:hypothetical protein
MDNLPILTLQVAAGIQPRTARIRNPLAAVGLLPGSRMTTDSVMRINGMPSNSQSINIEGQDATSGFLSGKTRSQAGMDAIQEVVIQTSNSPASMGRRGRVLTTP